MHLETRALVTGGPDSSDPVFVSDCSSRALVSSALTIFSRDAAQHRILVDDPRFELMRHDVTFPLYVGGPDLQFSLSCLPYSYQRDPVQTTKTSIHGAIDMLGLAKRLKSKFSGHRPQNVRRSQRSSAG